MSKRKTTDEFIKESNALHHYKYDYSKVTYIGSHSKVSIICPIHGEFLQSPNKHLKGQGCPECAKITRAKSISSSTEKFIEKAKKIHNGKYFYTKTKYIKTEGFRVKGVKTFEEIPKSKRQ